MEIATASLLAGVFGIAGFTARCFIPAAVNKLFSNNHHLTLDEHSTICSTVREQITRNDDKLEDIKKEILWIKAITIVKSSSEERERADSLSGVIHGI